jgi:EAL domain-containing protein (putative c-di-GMP-specific phosphodiesterase class I)
LRLSVNIPLGALMKLPIAALVRDNRPPNTSWPGLILEVSEDQVLRDIRLVHEIATQLSIYNVFLAIDRFGYAPNMMASLVDLPHVEFKLAHGFVSGCTQDNVKHELCESVVQLAHKYKHQVVAVGIDQRDDLQTLTQMGCDFGQGMLLGPPLPKDKIIKMIKIRAAQR